MAPTPDKTRRPGYAPTSNVGVGRRGLHKRERIVARAADAFLANGFHSTSLDTIAKAANCSRATVYQYFAGKEEIFRELSDAAGRAVLDHGERLGDLGPTMVGFGALHDWLTEWADIYDDHAAAFAEYPGIGTELSVIDAGPVAEEYRRRVTARLHAAQLQGLDTDDAAAVLMRIPHMVHLYRHRAMFALPARDVVARSLAVALQLMLFPDTPDGVIVAARDAAESVEMPQASVEEAAPTPAALDVELSPIAQEALSVSSALFAELGYYAVSMEDIAAAADISRATLYRHFSTKDRILAELTRRAVVEVGEHAATLPRIADTDALTRWMLGYVRFHRGYRGVIRAWFDGTVAEQLADAAVEHGIGAIHRAVNALLDTVELPPVIDRKVAGAVFLAVLGRMTEPTAADEADTDARAAHLITNLLRRSLLRSAGAQRGAPT
ncbi:TetR/AcrR family transcriptional regulator [Mycobacterium sp. 21AC1]|uniref:TetR/AcrR family transcriptional regulator n=1 Tax=[Mycobacterium] appelbergii TaxID=2939269 RepID=UPI002938DAF4|nr:TetR/AcrR family transcriptional regulator [Mycobacterium sp. 21AC1]MDV3124536.1 TetR/AcrR family transcriptional regulator [Mycobacterium sp. 21AC1]